MENTNYSQEENRDLVEMEDENGNKITLEVMRYFFYNGEEYVVLNALKDDKPENEEEEERIDCYIMKVVESEDGDEDMEEFLPIEDDILFEKLVKVAEADFASDQELGDE